MKDFSFQGILYAGDRLTTGKPGALRDLGDGNQLQIKLTADRSDRTESRSGKRLVSATLNKSIKAEFSLTLNEASAQNLAMATYGDVVAVASGSFTAEALPDDLVAGDVVKLDERDVSSVVITDSAGTPATATAGTNYEVLSAKGGLIKVLDPGELTQPFKAAGSMAAGNIITMFTSDAPEKYLVLDGINTVDGSRAVVRVYRARLDPASQLDLISDDFGNIQLSGTILYDEVNADDDELGGFASIALPEEG